MGEVSRLPCPNCDSSDAFSYNTDKHVGKCFSCGRGFTGDYDVGSGSSKSNVVKMQHREDANYKYISSRGITTQTMEFYGVKTLMHGDVAIQQEYVYPSGGKKIRRLPKTFTAEGLKSDELFGMNRFVAGTSKVVTITEGELDALSAWQMLGGSTSKWPTVVVSLPSASPAKGLWHNVMKWLDSFEKIILSIDTDGPGDEICAKINNLFPNKVYRVDHGEYKDANDFLQAGKGNDYKQAWYAAQRYMPDNILHTADDLLELFDHTPDHTYVPTGIPEFDEKAMGLMQGHFTVFKAPTGIGKTELMRYLEWNFLQRDVTFATWHLEETKLRSVLGLVSYDLGDNLTRKDLVEEKDKVGAVRESIKRITDGGNYYQYYLKENQGADDLIQQIRLLKEAYGCKFVMFEPIQDVITVGSEDSKESALAELSVRLSKLAADLNVGIVTIAHTNEHGDMKYCKMIGQRASVIVRLDRDKDAEDVEDRNTTRLLIEKNRPTSEEGPAGDMLFNTGTFTMRPL